MADGEFPMVKFRIGSQAMFTDGEKPHRKSSRQTRPGPRQIKRQYAAERKQEVASAENTLKRMAIIVARKDVACSRLKMPIQANARRRWRRSNLRREHPG